jgi:hypothetical protein
MRLQFDYALVKLKVSKDLLSSSGKKLEAAKTDCDDSFF